MNNGSSHQGFEHFRRERERRRLQAGDPRRPLGQQSGVLRALEQVEAKEMHEHKLSQEVHEFFSSATRTAAEIVHKVAECEQQATGARLATEMEDFLLDAFGRMNRLLLSLLQSRRGNVAQQFVEPQLHNIVGKSLDEFRAAGIAATLDQHLGQDPFATEVDEVCREFRSQLPDVGPDAENDADEATAAAPAAAGSAEPPSLLEDHLAARVGDEPTMQSGADAAAVPPTAPQPAVAASGPERPAGSPDLERFKEALKTMVRQGAMSRDEARLAWQARLRALQQTG